MINRLITGVVLLGLFLAVVHVIMSIAYTVIRNKGNLQVERERGICLLRYQTKSSISPGLSNFRRQISSKGSNCAELTSQPCAGNYTTPEYRVIPTWGRKYHK